MPPPVDIHIHILPLQLVDNPSVAVDNLPLQMVDMPPAVEEQDHSHQKRRSEAVGIAHWTLLRRRYWWVHRSGSHHRGWICRRISSNGVFNFRINDSITGDLITKLIGKSELTFGFTGRFSDLITYKLFSGIGRFEKLFDGYLNLSNIFISKRPLTSKLENKMQTVLNSRAIIYGEFDGEIPGRVIVTVMINVGFGFLIRSVVIGAGD